MMNNSKFLKSKHQILKEIQNKISSVKRNNSLKDLQSEIKLKNNSPFAKPNQQNGKDKDEKKNNIQLNESKTSDYNMQLIKNSSLILNEEYNNKENVNGGEIMPEYYGDKSSIKFINNDENTIFKKLNKKY